MCLLWRLAAVEAGRGCDGIAGGDPARLRFGRGLLGAHLVLRGPRHDLLELQFQLIDQPLCSLAARPMLLALQLADQQLEMRVQRLDARQLRLRIGRFRLGQQRGMSAGKVRWQEAAAMS